MSNAKPIWYHFIRFTCFTIRHLNLFIELRCVNTNLKLDFYTQFKLNSRPHVEVARPGVILRYTVYVRKAKDFGNYGIV